MFFGLPETFLRPHSPHTIPADQWRQYPLTPSAHSVSTDNIWRNDAQPMLDFHTRANRFYWLTKQILWPFNLSKCSWTGDHCLCLSLLVGLFNLTESSQMSDALIWLVFIREQQKLNTFYLVCDWECTWNHNPCAFASLSHSWSLGGSVWIIYPGTSAV